MIWFEHGQSLLLWCNCRSKIMLQISRVKSWCEPDRRILLLSLNVANFAKLVDTDASNAMSSVRLVIFGVPRYVL